MRALALGNLPIVKVRTSDDLVLAIAQVTGLTARAIRSRATRANGRKLVRTVFQERWPSRLEELGAEPCNDLFSDGQLVSELAGLVGSPSKAIAEALQASRNLKVREALAAEWPKSNGVPSSSVLDLTVQQARGMREPAALALALRIERSRFARRLRSSHGAMLLRNAFADLLPLAKTASNSSLKFDRYEVRGLEWTGGYGVVREAWDHGIDPGRRVVLKWPHGRAQAIKALEGEYRRARELRHPGLVGYFELQREPDGSPVLVIEHGGASLRERLQRRLMSLTEALTFCAKLAEALDYLVEQKLAHLDLHPSNVLVDDEGSPRVTDFGISRRLVGSAGNTRVTSEVPGYFPRFAAPEVESGNASRSSDQYSLALVFLSCLCGVEEAVDCIDRGDLERYLQPHQVVAFSRARNESSAKRFGSCNEFMTAMGEKSEPGLLDTIARAISRPFKNL